MYNRVLSAIAFTFITSPLVAWETQCHVDSFTDKESCTAYQEGEGGTLAFTSTDSDKAVLLVYRSNKPEYLSTDVFMVRVGDYPTIDLSRGGWLTRFAEGEMIMAGLGHNEITALLEQMANVDEVIRVRAKSSSGYSEAEFTLEGFSETWEELAELRDLPW